MKNDEHYDRVTEAWQDIMGNNFHFGYFEDPEVSLPQATNALIDKMASLAEITEQTTMLDVGCGIGGPAVYLADRYKCAIRGITTSRKGVEEARRRSLAHAGRLEFKVADGTNNGEADDRYDIVWVMESSHLMNQQALLRECYRVLKPEGTLLLCDVMLLYRERVANLMKALKSFSEYQRRPVYGKVGKSRRRVYGKVRKKPLEYYWKTLHKIGFHEITTLNISRQVFPTMAHWRQNIIKNEEAILAANKYTKQEISDFIQSCDRLETVFRQDLLGYAIIKAIKP